VLSDAMDELGLLCRLDDRGEPVIQLSPPLVADRQVLERMVSIVAESLARASADFRR
jgi:adenosylmethionine-8-amino-7-oxononanoate aminotransferase